MIYTCQRCGYITEHSSNYKKHINAKKICSPILSDVSKEQLLNDLSDMQNDKNYTCDRCNKKYKTTETLRVHKKTCPVNKQIENNIDNDEVMKQNIINFLNEKVMKQNIVTFLNENIESITDNILKMYKN
jgi:DNA-directed RNA polymerase subunit RPC12/RpoP